MLTSPTNQHGREFGCLQQPHPLALLFPFLSSQPVVVTESIYLGRFIVDSAPFRESDQLERGIPQLAGLILLIH